MKVSLLLSFLLCIPAMAMADENDRAPKAALRGAVSMGEGRNVHFLSGDETSSRHLKGKKSGTGKKDSKKGGKKGSVKGGGSRVRN
jgi:hypothetical protein